MPSEITFYSFKEAKEYASQKETEGIRIEFCHPKAGVYIVTLKKNKVKIPRGATEAVLSMKTPSGQYKIAKEKYHPWLSRKRIREIAADELKRAKIDIPFVVSEKLRNKYAIAGILNGKKLVIHPIFQYESEQQLRESMRHEIGHYREIESERKEEKKQSI